MCEGMNFYNALHIHVDLELFEDIVMFFLGMSCRCWDVILATHVFRHDFFNYYVSCDSSVEL